MNGSKGETARSDATVARARGQGARPDGAAPRGRVRRNPFAQGASRVPRPPAPPRSPVLIGHVSSLSLY